MGTPGAVSTGFWCFCQATFLRSQGLSGLRRPCKGTLHRSRKSAAMPWSICARLNSVKAIASFSTLKMGKWSNRQISFINYRYYGLLWVIPCHFRIRHGESPWMDDHWCHRRENKPWPSTRAALDDGSKLGAPLGHWTDKPLATGLSKTPLKWLVFGNPILVSGSGDSQKFYGFCQTW